jgi:hypothetical protein
MSKRSILSGWLAIVATFVIGIHPTEAQQVQLQVCRIGAAPGCQLIDGGLRVTNTSSSKTYRVAGVVTMSSRGGPSCPSCVSVRDDVADQSFTDIGPGMYRDFGRDFADDCNGGHNGCQTCSANNCCDNCIDDCVEGGDYFCSLSTGTIYVYAWKTSEDWNDFSPPVELTPLCQIISSTETPCPKQFP